MSPTGMTPSGSTRSGGPLDAVPPTRVSAATLVRRITVPTADRGGIEAVPATGYRELAGRIRSALLDGRLALSTTLPSERELAGASGLSRTTVAAAYGLLRDDGWLVSRRGSGSTLQFPDDRQQGGTGPWLRPGGAQDGLIDLTTASLPAAVEPVLAAVARAAAELPRYLGTDGYLPFGLPELRAVIADRYTAAGAPTGPDQILITNGAQHAFTLVLAELSGPGDRVLVESPTYPLALDVIRDRQRIPAPFGLNPEAENPWDIELIGAVLRHAAPRLGYLVPDFQNPTGALMDNSTRSAVLDAAAATSTTLVIDESLRDVPFDLSTPLPLPVAALAGTAQSRLISIGSVSKSLWGGLRVGWIRATPALIGRLTQARSLGDMAGSVLDQLVAASLLADPEDPFRIQRDRLATGCRALLAAVNRHLPDWRATAPQGGATIWVQLPGPFATELARLAPGVGVQIVPGPRFGPDGTMDTYLRLPFTQPPDQLQLAMSRLATVVDVAASGRPSTLDRWMI